MEARLLTGGFVAKSARLGAAAAVAVGLAFSGPAAAQDPQGNTIILGSAISVSGKYSQEGKDSMNGYDLGVKMINEHGGVVIHGKRYKFKIKYYDDESTPARTAELVERLINQDGIKYMLGPYSSGTTKAALPVTDQYKIPMVEAEGASRALFSQGYKYVFGALSTADQYLAPVIEMAATEAKRHGRNPSDLTVAMAFQNDPFSLDERAGVVTEAKKYGMKIVIDDKLPSDLSDMTATLTKVKALHPDILIISGHAKGSETGVRQMKELGVNAPVVAMTLCESAKLTVNFGNAANGILCPTQWAPTLKYRDKLFGTARDFNRLFLKTYPSYDVVPYQSAQAAAAIEIWANAFERAQSLDPQKLRDALAATDMETFYGNIKFNSRGENIAKPMVMRQIQNRKYEVVYPEKYADAKFEFPRKAPY